MFSGFTSGLMKQTVPSFPALELEVAVRGEASTAEAGWSKRTRLRQFAKSLAACKRFKIHLRWDKSHFTWSSASAQTCTR